MANATKYPSLTELTYFQWSRPGAARPNLARPINKNTIDASDATVFFSAAPVDDSGNVITDPFLFGIKRGDGTNEGYTMLCYAPNGADGSGGLSATGCVLGIKLKGLDFTTSDSDNVISFDEGDEIFCAIDAVMKSLGVAALQGTIATGGSEFVVGREQDEDMYFSVKNSSGVQQLFRKESSTGNAQYSDDGGSSWNNLSGALAGQLIVVTGADTTAGNLNAKISDGDGIAKSTLNPGGNEQLNLAVDLATDPGLEFDSNQLRVKVKSDGGITRDSDGLSADNSPFSTFTAGEAIDGSSTPQAVCQYAGGRDSIMINDASSGKFGNTAASSADYVTFGNVDATLGAAQSFTYTNDKASRILLKKIIVLGSETGTPTDLTTTIEADDGTGEPDDTPLTNSTRTASLAGGGAGQPQPNVITYPSDVELTSGQKYWFTMRPDDGNAQGSAAYNVLLADAAYSGHGSSIYNKTAGDWSTEDDTASLMIYFEFEIDGDRKIYKLDTDDMDRMNFVGWTTDNVAADASIIVQKSSNLAGFTSLEEGQTLYGSTTAGGYTQTPPSSGAVIPIGKATSDSEITIEKGQPRYAVSGDLLQGTASACDTILSKELYGDGEYFVKTGITPNKITGNIITDPNSGDEDYFFIKTIGTEIVFTESGAFVLRDNFKPETIYRNGFTHSFPGYDENAAAGDSTIEKFIIES